MQCEAVVFDLGDILYDASQWRRWLVRALEAKGVPITYSELVVRWEDLLVDVYRGQAKYWDRFDELVSGFGLSESAAGTIALAAAEKAQEVQKNRQPMEGVPETLGSLAAKHIRMAVLSDNEAGQDGIRSILRQLGIEEYFSAVVSSADIGVVKPSQRAYQTAVDAVQSTPSRCAFVGHDLDELEGAREAGLFVISYNCSEDLPSHAHLKAFSDLTTILG